MFPHASLKNQSCGWGNIENNENPPNDTEKINSDVVCIQKEIVMSTNSAETNIRFVPKYQQEEIEKLLKLADDGCDDMDEDNNTAFLKTTEEEEEMGRVPSLDQSLFDHELIVVSDHDMNYEICNQKKTEQIVSKQIQLHTAENVLFDHTITSVISSQNKTNEKLTNHNDDTQSSKTVNQKSETNGQAQKPVPAPRNLFLRPEDKLNKNLRNETNSDQRMSVRERAKTFSFDETCQIPPTPFRYNELFTSINSNRAKKYI